MKRKLVFKLLVPVGGVVFVTIGIIGFVFSSRFADEIMESADFQVASFKNRTIDMLNVVDDLSTKRVGAALKVFKERTSLLGTPRVAGTAIVAGQPVPNIAFGVRAQANNFDVVDNVNATTGAAATIFVKKGSDFVRISTNVKKADGSRAIGTVLDPSGKAIAAIRRGESFTGVVDILGKPYMTSYEPMKNSAGEVIGIWYAGYQINELEKLQTSIAQSRILDNGFTALLDNKNNTIFHSSHVARSAVETAFKEAGMRSETGWVTDITVYEKWGYSVVTSYSSSDVGEHISEVRWMVVVSGAVIIVLLIGFIYSFFTRLIEKPIGDIVGKMKNADIHTLFNEKREDEIGLLTRTFDQFVSTIKETLVHVNETSGSIASATTQISSSTHQMAAGTTEQAQQATEIAAAVEEMSKSIEHSAQSARRTATTAIESKQAASAGGESVQKTVQGMRDIAVVVNRTAETVRVLGKASDQIGEIVTVIEEIADQTNLLALNAAIEAARAGDQGRGFAVVADEVRKLAERTTSATKKIAETIKTIQRDTINAVNAIDEGTGKVETGIRIAEQAGESLMTIVDNSQKVADMVLHIANASEEQSGALGQISRNIQSISSVTQETAHGTEQVAAAAEDLNRLVLQLHQLLQRFHLDAVRRPVESHRGVTIKTQEYNPQLSLSVEPVFS